MTDRAKRILFAGVLPFVWLAAAIVPFVVAWSRLPDPVATHFGLSGAPNGALPKVAAFVLHASMASLAAIGVTVAIARRGAVAMLWLGTFVGVLFAGLGVATVSVNLDAAIWRDARPLTILEVLAITGIAVATASIVAHAARSLEPRTVALPAARATIGLGANERATWSSSAHNSWFGGLAVVSIAAAIITARVAQTPWATVGLAAAAILLAAFAVVHVRVAERGVSIAFGFWQFPRIKLPLSRIREARAIDVVPLQNGGWGYRGSLGLMGRASVVVRGGEGVELRVDDTKKLVITVDDSATAAGLVNDLIARQPNPPR